MTPEEFMDALEGEIANPMVLNSRELRALRGRFMDRHTLQSVAIAMGLTRERVRQLQNLGVRKIRANLAFLKAVRNVDPKTEVGDLNFGFRATNALVFAGYRTLADLLKATEGDLMSLRNFGRGSLDIVRGNLKRMGLELARPPVPLPKVDVQIDRKQCLADLGKIERQAEDLLKAVRRLAAEMTD
jgi:DNA-directed RNA polymerase alpha subunit